MKKCAVLIAGPVRYLISTMRRLEEIKAEVDLEYYIYLWVDDLGNKVRKDEQEIDFLSIKEEFNVKFISFSEPFCDEDYSRIINQMTEVGQSNISNIMGMFKSMDVLAKQIEISPLTYDAILRVRTDCLILDKSFFKKKYDLSKISVSKNYLIPHSWISDHLMLANKENFLKIWSWCSQKKLYEIYIKNRLNPERVLADKCNKHNLEIVEEWKRYLDYHIIYNPAKENEPSWIKNQLLNEDVKKIYENIDSIFDSKDVELLDIVSKQKANQDYYAKNIFIKLYLKIKSWKV
ncbi:hypothetical protein [Marinomonas polaris]|uniref:hypothetical protein n=1 Tax=Marinomonas polaris TaxID=293552 RepID=UPI003F9CF0A6